MPRLERSDSPLPIASDEASLGEPQVATIGRSLTIKGELTGSETLLIEGKVEGSIQVSGSRVTVGPRGDVEANIMARDIVVLGRVRGNCTASNSVSIRSEGSLTGNVIAARVSIEEGAFFKGGIDIRRSGISFGGRSSSAETRLVADEGSALADTYDKRAEESISQHRFQTIQSESDLEALLPMRSSSTRPLARLEATR